MQNRFLIILVFLTSGCDAAAATTGSLEIRVNAEDTITEGLAPGADLENIQDGWTVSFTKYIVALGHVELTRSDVDLEVHEEGSIVVDLRQTPENGVPVISAEAVRSGQWTSLSYETPIVTANTERHSTVTEADYQAMITGGCTYLISGTITKTDGQTCSGAPTACVPNTSVAFNLCVPAPTRYADCRPEDGQAGLNVPVNARASANVTIHGDHLFFSAFPLGAENIPRRAQWLANADTNVDGTVTEAELRALDAVTLFPSPDYNISGETPYTVTTGWDFVRAQLSTQGHFQGEGECDWNALGEGGRAGAHEHEGDDHSHDA